MPLFLHLLEVGFGGVGGVEDTRLGLLHTRDGGALLGLGLTPGRLRAFIRIADENIMASPVRMALWRSETASNGALLPLTDEELSLLHLFRQPSNDKLVSGEGLEVRAKAGVANNSNPSPLTPNPSPLTLNQFCRRARVPRFRAVRLLATFIRFGLVEEVFQNHAFVYRAIN